MQPPLSIDNKMVYTTVHCYEDMTEEMFLFVKEHDVDFYPPLSSRKSLAEFIQSVFNIDGLFIACFDNNRLVGLMGIGFNHPVWKCFYQYLAIDNDYRHKGIAQELFQRSHALSIAHGCTRAVCRTWSTNKASQSLFMKQGMVHIYTVTDDRGKGIHTYYFARSFSDFPLKQPITSLGIIGGIGTYAAGNFVLTLSSLRSVKNEQSLLPFILVNDPDFPNRTEAILNNKENELVEKLNNVVGKINQKAISHLVVLCFTIHPFINQVQLEENVALLNLVDFTQDLIKKSSNKWLLIASIGTYAMHAFPDNILVPNKKQSDRVYEIIFEIKEGIHPSYYKQEIVEIASINGCNGVILACTELHQMFGFEKMYGEIEILDPLLEFALFVENNRVKPT